MIYIKHSKNLILIILFISFIIRACKEELPEEHFNLNNKLKLTSGLLSVGGNAANVSLELENYNKNLYTEAGFCWGLEENPTISLDFEQVEVVGDTMAILLIDNLKPSTKYYTRGYTVYKGTPIYSNQLEIKTNEGLPVVTTFDMTTIGSTEATGSGEVLSDGDFEITARGLCWSLSGEPSIEDSITIDSSGLGKYTSLLTNLEMDTMYYVRAYATNSVGTTYGTAKSFRTKKYYPGISTTEVTGITSFSAISGGNITDDGGFDILARGICFGTSPNPTVDDDTTNEGTGKGNYTSEIKGLLFNTTYYVRAYATNRAGTVYGEERSFITEDGLPEVTTGDTSGVTDTKALCGGTVVSDGGYEIIEQGICWNTTGEPTVDDNKTIDASGLGTFTNELTGLTGETTYYVRAYAINIAGKAYGKVKTFTTALSNEGTLVDVDGNIYKWVRIGEQVWMAENLRVTHYHDGSEIPFIESSVQWDTLAQDSVNIFEGYTAYDYNPNTNDIHGLHYTLHTAREACPSGWHLPNDQDWRDLIQHLQDMGFTGEEGNALKTTSGWQEENGTDEYGFSAIPAGRIAADNGTLRFFDNYAYFWIYEGGFRYLIGYEGYKELKSIATNEEYGLSVRCLKDK